MASFADLLPEVLPDVPGCSDPLAEREIRNAVIRFCERTGVLKHTAPAQDIVALEPRYAIEAPTGYTFHSVLWLKVGTSQPLKSMSADFLDLIWRGDSHWSCHCDAFTGRGDDWRDYQQTEPSAYMLERAGGQDVLRLVGIPTVAVAGGLTYRLALKPLRTATEVEDFLLEDYYQTLAKGALSVLLRIPKKAWTDTARGVALAEEFENECGDARRDALKDFTRDDQANLRTRAYA